MDRLTRKQRKTAGGQIRRKEQTRPESEEKTGQAQETGTARGHGAKAETGNIRAMTQHWSRRPRDRSI